MTNKYMENEKEILNMINQLDKQDFELSSDIKLLFDEIKNIEDKNDISKVESEINSLKESIDSISLQKGDKGDKGDKGKDGKDGKDGKNGRDGIDGLDGKDGSNGKDGKDGSPDTPEQIVEKINKLENVIDIKTIKDFPIIEGNADIKRQVDTIGNQVLRLMSKQTQSVDLSGSVPTSRTITINGTTHDLSADRSWTISGGVSSLNTLTGALSITAGNGIGVNISGSNIEIINTGGGINIDGGIPNSTYGTLSPIDGGSA